MYLRDILVAAVIFVSLPICFRKPWIGVLVWSWIGYMNPHRLTWGFAYNMPFAMMVGIATIGGFAITKDRQRLPLSKEVFLFIALWGIFFLSTLFAQASEEAWNQFDKVSKVMIMTFVTLLLFQDSKKLKALIWVIALSIGFFGLKGGIFAIHTGGQYQILGPPESSISGNTEIGLALAMILPFLLFLRREETRPWVKHILSTVFLFSVISILITYSRGAFIGLAVVLLMLFLKSRVRSAAMLFVVIGISMAVAYLPGEWFERIGTIKTYEEDLSSMQRIRAWRLAIRIASDHPFLGAGFRAFSVENYEKYDPGGPPSRNDAHSIYFQILAEHGYLGLAIFLGLIISTMISLRQIMWKSQRDTSLRWFYNFANMLETGLLGYLVSGAFLSMSYFDLFYHMVAISIILKKLFLSQEQEMIKLSPTEEKLPTSHERV